MKKLSLAFTALAAIAILPYAAVESLNIEPNSLKRYLSSTQVHGSLVFEPIKDPAMTSAHGPIKYETLNDMRYIVAAQETVRVLSPRTGEETFHHSEKDNTRLGQIAFMKACSEIAPQHAFSQYVNFMRRYNPLLDQETRQKHDMIKRFSKRSCS